MGGGLYVLIPDDAILDYQVPPMHEQYTEAVENGPFPARSTMELQPTPMASQRVLPNAWKWGVCCHADSSFKMGPGTVLEEVWDDEAQEPKKRYVNKSRAVGLAVQAIAHGDSPVPEGPERSVRDRIPKLDKRILKRMQEVGVASASSLTPAVPRTSCVAALRHALSIQ